MAKKDMKNFEFALGLGMNWVDLSKGRLFHVQEYKEALDRGEHPAGIRVTNIAGDEELGVWSEIRCQDEMRDPDIDPKYAPETLKEHRESMK